MKKTFLKIGAILIALSMFGSVYAADAKPYQKSLNKFLKLALGDLTSFYITCPPEGKEIIDEMLAATALMNGTSVQELSDGADSMIVLTGASIKAESETALNKDQLKSIRTYLNYVLENGPDYKGKEIGEIIPITDGYEIGVQIYSFGAPQSNELAPLVVYKAGEEWYILKGSMALLEQQVAAITK